MNPNLAHRMVGHASHRLGKCIRMFCDRIRTRNQAGSVRAKTAQTAVPSRGKE